MNLENMNSEDSNSPTAKSNTKDFVQSFAKMFDSDFLTDVTIVVNGSEIKAHKFVLAARSRVFKAMFEHNLTEQQQNRVIIEDIDYDVVKEMLRYMYTTTAPNLIPLVDGLLIAADKLKERCEIKLIANLCANASETLILADKCNAKQLEEKMMKFIDTHYQEVRRTEGWLQVHSPLLRKLLDVSKNVSPPLKRAKLDYGN